MYSTQLKFQEVKLKPRPNNITYGAKEHGRNWWKKPIMILLNIQHNKPTTQQARSSLHQQAEAKSGKLKIEWYSWLMDFDSDIKRRMRDTKRENGNIYTLHTHNFYLAMHVRYKTSNQSTLDNFFPFLCFSSFGFFFIF